MKLLKEEKLVDGELDEKTSHKLWWVIPQTIVNFIFNDTYL